MLSRHLLQNICEHDNCFGSLSNSKQIGHSKVRKMVCSSDAILLYNFNARDKNKSPKQYCLNHSTCNKEVQKTLKQKFHFFSLSLKRCIIHLMILQYKSYNKNTI